MGQTVNQHDQASQPLPRAAIGSLPVAPLDMPKQILESPDAAGQMRRRLYRWLAPLRPERFGLGR
jgi:hypothetical protein